MRAILAFLSAFLLASAAFSESAPARLVDEFNGAGARGGRAAAGAVEDAAIRAQREAAERARQEVIERQNREAFDRAQQAAAERAQRESQSAALEQQRRTLDQARQQQRNSSIDRGVQDSGSLPNVSQAPDFIVSKGGTVFPVPTGSTGPKPVVNPAGNQTGSAFTGGNGGANGQVESMRIMNPTPQRGNVPAYPDGYVKYENKSGQGVDPYTGKTENRQQTHFPLK